jgi:hypothetical protein
VTAPTPEQRAEWRSEADLAIRYGVPAQQAHERILALLDALDRVDAVLDRWRDGDDAVALLVHEIGNAIEGEEA